MRLKFLTIVLALAFLASCTTDPNSSSESSGASSTGGASGTASGTGSGGAGSGDQAGAAGVPNEAEWIQVGDRVFFNYDSYTLSQESQSVLQRQAQFLRQFPNLTITVEGHCDERGTREYNLALGERRANAVKDYMIGLGMDANRIRTISYGKERPVVLGATDQVWAQNRRSVTVIN